MNKIFELNIMNTQLLLFHFVNIIIYSLIAISILKNSKDSIKVLNRIEFYFRIYTSLFLIWRFNPFRKNIILSNLDKQIIFSSAFFLLFMIFLHDLLLKFEPKIKNYFNKKNE
jgi:hypothetical protein